MKAFMIFIIIGMVFSTISVIQRVAAGDMDCAPVEQEAMPDWCVEQPHGPRFWGRR